MLCTILEVWFSMNLYIRVKYLQIDLYITLEKIINCIQLNVNWQQ
jgi:hypothetical protein